MALVFPSTPTPGQTYAAPNGITYTWDNTLGVWAASADSLAAASLAEAATGTINTKFSSPQTAVPKDASGMTGAAILPNGTLLQRPGTPAVGMQRFNTDSGFEEVYTGATLGWQNLAYSITPAFYATVSTSNPPLAANTTTVVPFNSVGYDNKSAFDTTTYRYTPTVPGTYWFSSSSIVNIGPIPAANVSFVTALYKNGAIAPVTLGGNFPFTYSNTNWALTPSAFVQMNGTTDYVDVRVTLGQAGNLISGPAGFPQLTFQGFLVQQN